MNQIFIIVIVCYTVIFFFEKLVRNLYITTGLGVDWLIRVRKTNKKNKKQNQDIYITSLTVGKLLL